MDALPVRTGAWSASVARAASLILAVLGSLTVLTGCNEDKGLPTAEGLSRTAVGEAAERAQGPNVLLITLDTLRADHVGAYGYRLDTTPALDDLAGRGTRFDDVTVPTPKTWPSIASLLTGASPRTTTVRLQNRRIKPGLPVLAELFDGAGYRTGAVVTNFNLLEGYGYGRGFQTYQEAWDQAWGQAEPDSPLPGDAHARLEALFGSPRMRAILQATDAQLVTDRALAWLPQTVGEQPFFLWLHYMDPHGPYDPPQRYAELFAGEYDEQQVTVEQLNTPHLHRQPGTDEPVTDMGFYRAQYDREIRSMDDQLGRLFAELDARGLASDTLVVVTADHGEALGDHGYYLEHGLQAYQECARVPLIVAHRGSLPTRSVISEPVGLLDVAPTVLELAGLPVPTSFEGHSLAPLLRGESGATAPDFVFMESGNSNGDRPLQLTVRSGRWKLILVPSKEDQAFMGGVARELYDVWADPDEQHNVAADHPQELDRLSTELHRWARQHPEPGKALSREAVKGMSPEQIAFLRALGY
jgi:arylsulfatase A-like enzyme